LSTAEVWCRRINPPLFLFESVDFNRTDGRLNGYPVNFPVNQRPAIFAGMNAFWTLRRRSQTRRCGCGEGPAAVLTTGKNAHGKVEALPLNPERVQGNLVVRQFPAPSQ
jgi:hypothetical protein